MIYIIWAPPRKGKTYFATNIAINALKKISKKRGSKNKVFSNYPIFHKKYGSTLFWDKDTYQYNITDSLIIIDEAYRDYNARKYHKFSNEEHTFFATNGHSNNDIFLIAHGIHRLDSVIREMVDQFYFVKKYGIPFVEKPLFFIIEGYLDEIDIANRYRRDAVYSKQWLWFKKSVAECYDTHYFKNQEEEDFIYESWIDYYNQKRTCEDGINV
jgi:uncharacterized protein YqkB